MDPSITYKSGLKCFRVSWESIWLLSWNWNFSLRYLPPLLRFRKAGFRDSDFHPFFAWWVSVHQNLRISHVFLTSILPYSHRFEHFYARKCILHIAHPTRYRYLLPILFHRLGRVQGQTLASFPTGCELSRNNQEIGYHCHEHPAWSWYCAPIVFSVLKF